MRVARAAVAACFALVLDVSAASAQHRRAPGFAAMPLVKPVRPVPQAAALPGAYQSASARPPRAFLAGLDRRLSAPQPRIIAARAPALPPPRPRVFAARAAAAGLAPLPPSFAASALSEAPRGALDYAQRHLPLPVHAPRPPHLDGGEDCPPVYGQRRPYFAEAPLEWREEPDLRRFKMPGKARKTSFPHRPPAAPRLATGGPFPASYAGYLPARIVK